MQGVRVSRSEDEELEGKAKEEWQKIGKEKNQNKEVETIAAV